jgi:hypothetical protein
MHLPLYHLSSTLAGSPIVDPFNGTSYFTFLKQTQKNPLSGKRGLVNTLKTLKTSQVWETCDVWTVFII